MATRVGHDEHEREAAGDEWPVATLHMRVAILCARVQVHAQSREQQEVDDEADVVAEVARADRGAAAQEAVHDCRPTSGTDQRGDRKNQ